MKLRTTFGCGASLLCLAMPATAFAQTTDTPTDQPAASAPATDTEGEDIVVTGIRHSIETAQEIKRDADTVVEAIAPQDLGKFTDQSIADAFQRVPGVQIQRSEIGTAGDRASIRGLGSAYVQVTVNGRTPLSYGSEGINQLRSFNLDSLPSEVISGALVYKMPTADLIETGLAGAIDIQTLKPLDYRVPDRGNVFGSATVSGRFDDVNSDVAPRVSGVLGAKLLDDTLGIAVSGVWSRANNHVDALVGAPAYVNVRVRNAQGGVDTIPDVLYPRFAANTLDGEIKRFATSAAIQWKPTDQIEVGLEWDHDRFDRPWKRATHEIRFAGANFSLRNGIYEPGSIEIEDGTVVFADMGLVTPPPDGGNPNNIRSSFESTSFFYNNLSTTDQVGLNVAYYADQFTLKGDLSASWLDARQQLFSFSSIPYSFPTNVGVVYSNPDGRHPVASIPSSADIFQASNYGVTGTTSRVFQNEANNKAFRLDGDWEAFDNVHLQFGGRYSTQLVDVRAANRTISLTPEQRILANNLLWTGEVGHNETSDVLGVGSFPYRDIEPLYDAHPEFWVNDDPGAVPFTGPFDQANDPTATLPLDTNNSYRVRENILAFYGQVSGKGQLGELDYSGNIGLRAVWTEDKAQAFQGVRIIDQATNGQISSTSVPVKTKNDYWKLLPSANLSLYPAENLTLRLAVARTMSRPEFEQLSPIGVVTKADPTRPLYNPNINDTARIGNIDLKPLTAWNYDATLEYYPNWGGAYYLSAFYKDLKDFVFTGLIRNQTLPGEGDRLFDVTTATNAADGRAYGFEVGFNQPLTFLPGFWGNFGLGGNFTYVNTKFDTDNVLLQAGIPGASKYNANASAYYEDDKLQVRASYVYRGDYLATLGNGQDRNQLPTFTRARGVLDASISYKFLPNLEVILTGTNLTKADRFDYIYEKRIFREHDVLPRAFTLAGRVTF